MEGAALPSPAFSRMEIAMTQSPPAEERLLPCPFCGYKDIELQTAPRAAWATTVFWAKCLDCGATCREFKQEGPAIKAWNTRASDRPEKGEKDELNSRFKIFVGPSGTFAIDTLYDQVIAIRNPEVGVVVVDDLDLFKKIHPEENGFEFYWVHTMSVIEKISELYPQGVKIIKTVPKEEGEK